MLLGHSLVKLFSFSFPLQWILVYWYLFLYYFGTIVISHIIYFNITNLFFNAEAVLGAVTVVGAMPPKAISMSTTWLWESSWRLKAALTTAISSSLRFACLYAAKYWFWKKFIQRIYFLSISVHLRFDNIISYWTQFFYLLTVLNCFYIQYNLVSSTDVGLLSDYKILWITEGSINPMC